MLVPEEGGAMLRWQGWGGGRGRGGLLKVHCGGGHGLQWRCSWVALLLLFDGGSVRGHLEEAGGLGLVAPLHEDIEAGKGGGGGG